MLAWLYFAATKLNPGDIGYNPTVRDNSALNNSVSNITSTVYAIAGMVAVLVIVIAGYMFAVSNGNADRVRKARFMILGASVGLVVVLMAFLITQLVIRWVAT